jgi:hypothetical protein
VERLIRQTSVSLDPTLVRKDPDYELEMLEDVRKAVSRARRRYLRSKRATRA